ncbi:hypothetical protein SDC9_200991 [bioreactor metagenome]|uniref:Uncharacterized protein n=1 Tax=bioreactor metagenome TaxID=1076179 RepID=A0A645IQ23_9ZZZZ
MREVKTKLIRIHKRTGLVGMIPQNILQRLVQQMRCCMIFRDASSARFIHVQDISFVRMDFRQDTRDVHRLAIRGAFDVFDFCDHFTRFGFDRSFIRNLTTHFCIERRFTENDLNAIVCSCFFDDFVIRNHH